MLGVDVRRLAAIDMWGTSGTRRRRRVILAEFTVGFVVAVAFGAWIVTVSSGVGGRLFGAWMFGAGLNYAPLAFYAILLTRADALDDDLAGVDTDRELRRYGVLQLWTVIPLALLVFAARDEVMRGRARAGR